MRRKRRRIDRIPISDTANLNHPGCRLSRLIKLHKENTNFCNKEEADIQYSTGCTSLHLQIVMRFTRRLMGTRSSRLFIILLHLVGVRTNLPLRHWKVGIVGVHPVSIVLENLPLDPSGGLDGLLRQLPISVSEAILDDPYWLQVGLSHNYSSLSNL